MHFFLPTPLTTEHHPQLLHWWLKLCGQRNKSTPQKIFMTKAHYRFLAKNGGNNHEKLIARILVPQGILATILLHLMYEILFLMTATVKIFPQEQVLLPQLHQTMKLQEKVSQKQLS